MNNLLLMFLLLCQTGCVEYHEPYRHHEPHPVSYYQPHYRPHYHGHHYDYRHHYDHGHHHHRR